MVVLYMCIMFAQNDESIFNDSVFILFSMEFTPFTPKSNFGQILDKDAGSNYVSKHNTFGISLSDTYNDISNMVRNSDFYHNFVNNNKENVLALKDRDIEIIKEMKNHTSEKRKMWNFSLILKLF